MLSIRNLEAGYGSLKVLRGLSLEVPRGRVVALLGGNGAGKTTTMNAIAGLLPAAGGEIRFEDRELRGLPSHRVFARGIALVAQGRALFAEMTVRENLELGALAARSRPDIVALTEDVFRRFPRLRERVEQRAASLSGGEQQMLATGRALMSRPSLLLLDEPTTGLAPIIVSELGRIIRELNAGGLTILLVEQNVRMALQVADEVYVMRNGEIVLHGAAAELQNSDEMFSSYLG
ncbi:MAG: ABC transporter ATP-binding protein [Acidisphaera sp.]|nr:ABC transporter ATP-binding protein [Acidisphaera sp.]